MQTAFVSLFYIFINMKTGNASNSSVVVGRPRPLWHLTNFVRIFTNFFNFRKFVKIRDFFCWGNEFSIYVWVHANKLNCKMQCARHVGTVVAVLRGSVWAASLLSCVTGCSLYMIVCVCMSYMLVRLSGCLNHIKETIIIIIVRTPQGRSVARLYFSWGTGLVSIDTAR